MPAEVLLLLISDKEWPASCPADQTIEIAKLIGEHVDS
jgi:hypothetical protein